MIRIVGLFAMLTYAAPLVAAEVEELEVTHADGIYRVRMVFSVAAPINGVRAVLTDYAHLTALHPSVVESSVLPAPRDGVTRVRTRVHDCFLLIFCFNITRVDDVAEGGAGGFRAAIVPGSSDMKSGRSRWRFERRADATRIIFDARMAPDFWVPPLIGPAIIKSRLRTQLAETAVNVERLATRR